MKDYEKRFRVMKDYSSSHIEEKGLSMDFFRHLPETGLRPKLRGDFQIVFKELEYNKLTDKLV